MLRLQIFGTGRAYYHDQPLPGFPRRLPWLLFCYLLLNHNQTQSRERLAAVFWSEYSTSASRKHLRNTLWRLRSLLQAVGASPDEYLRIDASSVSFLPTGRYSLDVHEFEETILRYRYLAGRELTPDMALQLQQAVDLYTGDLLVDVYQDWCQIERERFSRLYLDTLIKLAGFYEFIGDAESGLVCDRAILSRDNTDERTHRQMMRLYWQAGERNSALAQYRLCTQILRDTLGIAPQDETTSLYHQIQSSHFIPLDRPRRPQVLSSPADKRPPAQADPPRLEQIVHQLRYLSATIAQVSAELHQIERQLDQFRRHSDDE